MKFLGGDFVTGVSFGREGRRRTSLFIGPSYKRLTQEAEIFAYESNRESTVNNMALGEKLKSSYYGGVAGIHIDAPFKKRWNFSVGGEFGIYYLDSEYEGFQKTFLSSGGPDDLVAATVYLKTSDSKMTAATGVQASLRVKYLTRITFEVESGIKYQAHSPVMRYARLGESFRNRIAHSPARLEYAGMFGFLGKFSVGFEF